MSFSSTLSPLLAFLLLPSLVVTAFIGVGLSELFISLLVAEPLLLSALCTCPRRPGRHDGFVDWEMQRETRHLRIKLYIDTPRHGFRARSCEQVTSC